MTEQPFDAELRREAESYLQTLNEKRGPATSKRQVGQRKRRLREALYKLASISTGKMSFTSDEASFREAAINATVNEANIANSIGSDIERYGSPPGGELIDDTDYDDETDDDEVEDYTLFPQSKTIFGTKDGFADWMRNVYLKARPDLDKMIKYNYWKVKDGSIHYGSERSSTAKRKAHKWISMRLRQHISEKGIRPNSVIFSPHSTILNYDSGSHTLDKGRDD